MKGELGFISGGRRGAGGRGSSGRLGHGGTEDVSTAVSSGGASPKEACQAPAESLEGQREELKAFKSSSCGEKRAPRTQQRP